jgi:hypothetical protein
MFVSLFSLLLLVVPAAAHNGAVLTAAAAAGLRADGDLNDWPALPGARLPYAEYGTPPTDARDLEATLYVAWDEPARALFVGLDVRDADPVFVSPTTSWNAQDGCELYIDSDHADASAARQHVLRGPWNVSDGSAEEAASAGVWAGLRQSAGGYVCEWRVDLSALPAERLADGTSIGFDVAVNDYDPDGSFTWLSWGAGVQKQTQPARRGDVVLPGSGGQTGHLDIHAVAGSRPLSRHMLHLEATGNEDLSLHV